MMVLGCMGWNGVGMLTEVEGRMDAKQYVEIMDQHLLQSMEDLGIPLEKAILQQDNDPKHTSKLAQHLEFRFVKIIKGAMGPKT